MGRVSLRKWLEIGVGRGEEQSSQGVGHPRSRLQKEQPAIQGEGSDPRETSAVRLGGDVEPLAEAWPVYHHLWA